MYFPYLRSKQNELQSLLNLPKYVFNSGKIVPIIEPVTDLKKSNIFAAIRNQNIPFILIANPNVGKNASSKVNQIIKDQLIDTVFAEYKNYWVGFIITSQTTLAEIRSFFKIFPNNYTALIHDYNFKQTKELIEVLQKEKSLQYNIFIDNHTSGNYRNELSKIDADDILLKDGFRKQINNSLYPPEDYFSDQHLTYDNDGYAGFGDFQMIGYPYQENGGPAHAVAIHLTTKDENDNSLAMHHFVSDNITGPVDPGGKFLESLKKLNIFLNKNPQYDTAGVKEYKNLYKIKHFPGLGVVKRLSIMHHIEFVFDQL